MSTPTTTPDHPTTGSTVKRFMALARAETQAQAQQQTASGNPFTALTQQAQPQQAASSGLNIGSIMGSLLQNVDIGKILLSLLK